MGGPIETLFVHGAGGGPWEWSLWQRTWAALGRPSRAIDLRPLDPLEATRFADYCAQLLDAIGSRPVVLVGASLGGLLALSVAGSNTTDVRALVLVNPIPPSPWSARLPPREREPPVIPWGRVASLAGTRRAVPDADDATCAVAWRLWRDESRAVLDDAYDGIDCVRTTIPTLAVASGDDDDVPPALTREVALALGWTIVDVAGASHVGPLLGRSAGVCAEQAAAWVALAERLQIRA